MNCILLNNEFNLKELPWLLNTMQNPPKLVYQTRCFILGHFTMDTIFRFGKVRSNYMTNRRFTALRSLSNDQGIPF